jgi:cell division topological specificity factor
MTGFFDRMLGRGGKGSGLTAKERLQFILVHDRINLPPEQMEEMKREILAVISKYVPVDSANVDIALQQRERSSLVVAEIPLARRKEGIERDDPTAMEPKPAPETKPDTVKRDEDTPTVP